LVDTYNKLKETLLEKRQERDDLEDRKRELLASRAQDE
jgi:hypothetical protein